MVQSFADTAIDILIKLAEQGEIDPWDIQVIEVFDRCLAELASRGQPNLSESGQAFLDAAMLVFLKSNRLMPVDEAPVAADFKPETVDIVPHPSSVTLPHQLEQHLHRRLVAPPQQRRRVTLDELIVHLKTMAAQTERAKVLRPHPRRRRPATLKTIAQLAHPENLTEMAAEVETLLATAAPLGTWLCFRDLLSLRNDPVGVFWALLFLAAQSKVDLSQDTFYQDLRVRSCCPTELSAQA